MTSPSKICRVFNPIIRGWLQYYGRFYRSALYPPMRQLDRSLACRPSDLKCALESPTDRALVFAKYQGPSQLPAVLLAKRGRTPSSSRAARRRRGVFHCRHMAAVSRNRTQQVKHAAWRLARPGTDPIARWRPRHAGQRTHLA